MAVARVNKLLIITHKSEEERVLRAVQKTAIAEVNPFTNGLGDISVDMATETEMTSEVSKALSILEDYKDKELKKAAAKAGKIQLSRKEYDSIVKDHDFDEITDSIIDTDAEIRSARAQIQQNSSRIEELSAWKDYKGDIGDLGPKKDYTVQLGAIRARNNDRELVFKGLSEKSIAHEVLSSSKESCVVILAYHDSVKEDAEQYISGLPFEKAEIGGYKGTIEKNIADLKKNIQYDSNRLETMENDLAGHIKKYEKPLTVYLDHVTNSYEIEKAIDSGYSTDSVSFYTAWVKEKDRKAVDKVIEDHRFSKTVEIEPEEGEQIPVALENNPLFRPFEVIINLYGVPRYYEIDPTPFVSLFFALFFGLCLTDAGYGILLAVLTLIFAFRMKNMKNFLMLIFFGALFTVLAGAMFNGWFGDLPSYLGFGEFFRNIAFLGDPLKSQDGAMNFFRLALILGVVQVVFGLFIKFFDSIRRRDWQGAFFDGLPWIVIVISLVIMLLSTTMAVDLQLVAAPIFSSSVAGILVYVLLAAALVIILFAARDEKSWGLRLFMGFLNLTIVNGITAYLGDFLSYIRLMALGLVTAGIGVAINTIAFQIGNVPYIGIVLIVVILIFGHIFNIAINILGGFVHTLRLQYVEFFPKFYVGGGKPMRLLRSEHRYVKITDTS